MSSRAPILRVLSRPEGPPTSNVCFFQVAGLGDFIFSAFAVDGGTVLVQQVRAEELHQQDGGLHSTQIAVRCGCKVPQLEALHLTGLPTISCRWRRHFVPMCRGQHQPYRCSDFDVFAVTTIGAQGAGVREKM
jgi:hypothetical protein